mmetsp:Transcript_11912/g.32605  ORF Transcript_11912/g.32605 Transcript_11912/m.32605 type:complete len:209 (+) Transcript_11912:587-1213(+)
MSKSEVPLSTMAPQPWSQPTRKPSSLAPSFMSVMRMVQVCLPRTSREEKMSGLSRAEVSFQMKYPGEPGCFPRQIEKIPTSSALMSVGCRPSSVASAASVRRRSWVKFVGNLASSDRCRITTLTSSCTSFQASELDVSGGPTPMIELKAAFFRTGMSADVASQKLRFTGSYGPMVTLSKPSLTVMLPLPKYMVCSSFASLKSGLWLLA